MDSTQPSSFFSQFEKAMFANEEPKARWAVLLPAYLAGKAQEAYQNEVSPDISNNYDLVKQRLLQLLGDTPEEAARWSASRSGGETYDSYATRLQMLFNRMISEQMTMISLKSHVILSCFVHFLLPSCATYVSSRNPTSVREAARWADQFMSMRRDPRIAHPDLTIGGKDVITGQSSPQLNGVSSIRLLPGHQVGLYYGFTKV